MLKLTVYFMCHFEAYAKILSQVISVSQRKRKKTNMEKLSYMRPLLSPKCLIHITVIFLVLRKDIYQHSNIPHLFLLFSKLCHILYIFECEIHFEIIYICIITRFLCVFLFKQSYLTSVTQK